MALATPTSITVWGLKTETGDLGESAGQGGARRRARTEAPNVKAESVEKTNDGVFGVDLPICFRRGLHSGLRAWQGDHLAAPSPPQPNALGYTTRLGLSHTTWTRTNGPPPPAVPDRSSGVGARKFALQQFRTTEQESAFIPLASVPFNHCRNFTTVRYAIEK